MSNLPELTEELAYKALTDFFREKPFLFLGSGISCALDPCFGMPSFKAALLARMKTYPLSDIQRNEWSTIEKDLNNGKDLENALDLLNDSTLLKIITMITGEFIASNDQEYAFRISSGEIEYPAARLIKRLVETLPEGDRILHVLTTNYDMLFEYGCEQARTPYTNGFWGGIERIVDWSTVDRALRIPEHVYQARRLIGIFKHSKHLRLHKVHGSLNYFYHRGNVIENNAWMWSPPSFAERVMITPGLSKYEMLQKYRLELLRAADNAIERESRFLFIGYGFNDLHLEEYIKRKLVAQGCRGLIITRDSNPRIETLVGNARNLWIVCKEENVACEDDTRIFNSQYSNWLSIPGRKLWDIREFTSQILGE